MIIDYQLSQSGSHLWGRPKGATVRQAIEDKLGMAQTGDIVMVDFTDVEVMDYSFSNEVFGKLLSRLPREHTGKHLALKNLNDYVKENLEPALRDLKLIALVIQGERWQLIGNAKNTDVETLRSLEELGPADLASIAQKLGISVTACSNRLNKLAEQGLIKKLEVEKPVGNEKYMYAWLF